MMSRTHNNFEYIVIKGNKSISLQGDATQWNDLKFPAENAQINPVTAKPVFNYDSPSFTFARSGNETIVGIGQFGHDYALGTDIEAHFHWEQTAAGTPKFQLDYKWYDNGEAIPAFTAITTDSAANVFTYTSGTIGQMCDFPTIDGSSIGGVSSMFIWKLTRLDTASGDTYTADVTLTEFDVHYQIDAFGSNDEYTK